MATTAQLFKQVTMPDFKGKVDPGLVPGMRRFRRAGRIPESAGGSANPTAQRGDDQRHRLLLQLAGLHQYLRHAHAAWPRAGGGHRRQARQSRADRGRYRRRRRRLRHRRQPFHPHYAPQRGPAVPGDGQPDLRIDHGPDFAHQPGRHEDQERAVRQCRAADQSDCAGASRPAPPS